MYEVGDYVFVTREFDYNPFIVEQVAKIKGFYNSYNYGILYRLEFLGCIGGHSSDGTCRVGCGWNVPETHFVSVNSLTYLIHEHNKMNHLA